MTNPEDINVLEVKDCTSAFEEAHAKKGEEKYVLRLYVAGMGPKSVQAINNLKKICEEYLQGRCQIEVIDIYQNPIYAKDGQIVAAPTLIKELPLPLKKIIGSMADTERVLVGLNIEFEADKK